LAQTEFEDTNLVIRICISQQTTQWPKEKVENDNQRSTKHTYKTKGRVTRAPLKTGGELRCSGRVTVPARRTRYGNVKNTLSYTLCYIVTCSHDDRMLCFKENLREVSSYSHWTVQWTGLYKSSI
jgi:hypothetical protein